MAECRSCHAPILWAITDKGKRMPLHPEPDPAGNLEHVGVDMDGQMQVRSLKAGEGDTLPGIEPPPRFRSHYADCPDAEQWRRS